MNTDYIQERSIISNARDLNLRASFESGQPLAFYAGYKIDDGTERLEYVTQRGAITVSRKRLEPGRMAYSFIGDYTRRSAYEEIKTRFALDHDMRRIYSHINTDPFMNMAINSFYGMRITGNQPWEAALCFIVSQFNNIKRIRMTTLNLIQRFGEKTEAEGVSVRLFPSPQAIANASTKDIMACGTGFRAKYIKSAAAAFAENKEYSGLHRMDYAELKERLMSLDGIGDKVADCILLFGYSKHEAFPIDVWIKRIVEKVYFNGRTMRESQIHDFATNRWGAYSGYAQQYLFWHGRSMKTGVSNDK